MGIFGNGEEYSARSLIYIVDSVADNTQIMLSAELQYDVDDYHLAELIGKLYNIQSIIVYFNISYKKVMFFDKKFF